MENYVSTKAKTGSKVQWFNKLEYCETDKIKNIDINQLWLYVLVLVIICYY